MENNKDNDLVTILKKDDPYSVIRIDEYYMKRLIPAIR